jgi:uncharacterized protein YbbK (DUF523 family)
MDRMGRFPKPIVVVSKCIEFQPVRWDSEVISSDFVKKLKHCVTFIPVCPEVEIGLGVPRDPLRIVSSLGKLKLVHSDTGTDLTDRMLEFAESFLNSLPAVDGFILKSKSPSCAIKDAKVYPDCQKPVAIARAPGLFAKRTLQKYPHAAVEDEQRLANPRTADRFLKRVFTSARLRHAKVPKLPEARAKLEPGRHVQRHPRPSVRAKRRLG